MGHRVCHGVRNFSCHVIMGGSAMNESYTITIERKDREFTATRCDVPADPFGAKMMSIILYNIAEHIDPALKEGFGEGVASDDDSSS